MKLGVRKRGPQLYLHCIALLNLTLLSGKDLHLCTYYTQVPTAWLMVELKKLEATPTDQRLHIPQPLAVN